MNRRAIHYTTTVILEEKNVGGIRIFTFDVIGKSKLAMLEKLLVKVRIELKCWKVVDALENPAMILSLPFDF